MQSGGAADGGGCGKEPHGNEAGKGHYHEIPTVSIPLTPPHTTPLTSPQCATSL